QDAGIFDTAGVVRTRGVARIDHELRRNITLTARVTVEQADFEESLIFDDPDTPEVETGVEREDDIIEAFLAGTYLLNRRVGLEASATRFSRSSNDPNADYDTNRFGMNLLVRY
ncbi:MAG: outer membrane beta-barrel protein, partial [Caulobacterales bacterium]|nr:outer membrane beta-barrel protein [Caulobacterales bacterium]